jgi:DNA-binding XRE family transcriptional regulator
MSNVEKLRTEHESTHEKLAQSQTHSKNSLIKKQKGKDNGEESGTGGGKEIRVKC